MPNVGFSCRAWKIQLYVLHHKKKKKKRKVAASRTAKLVTIEHFRCFSKAAKGNHVTAEQLRTGCSLQPPELQIPLVYHTAVLEYPIQQVHDIQKQIFTLHPHKFEVTADPLLTTKTSDPTELDPETEQVNSTTL